MEDWEDVEGWNSFHVKDYKNSYRVNFSFLHPLLEELIARKNICNVWFPGCGISTEPKVFTELGFNVWATDVSDFAIAIQRELTQKSVEQIGMLVSVPNEQDEWETHTFVDYFLKYGVEDFSSEGLCCTKEPLLCKDLRHSTYSKSHQKRLFDDTYSPETLDFARFIYATTPLFILIIVI
jgi:hypothetical protein